MNDVEDQYKDSGNLAARANLHAKYGTAPVAWHDWVTQQVAWPAGASVLDVGCGPGSLWPAVAARLTAPIRLTLSDLSPGMVAEAVARTKDVPHVEVVAAEVANAQSLPFDDASFDVVVANHMLYHVPDRPLAIAEFARVLRPHGVLVAAANGRDNMRELFEIEHHAVGRGGTFAALFGRENGAGLLAASFVNVEWRSYDDELRCTDVDDVAAYVASIEGSPVTPELREAVAARFADGVLTLTKDTGLFIASKSPQ